MDLLPTAEQQQIVDAVRGVLAQGYPLERLRSGTHITKVQWRELAALGWFGLGLPESVGGSGLSLAEEALLSRELGRYLMTPGLLATNLAAHLALHDDAPGLSESFVFGDKTCALGIAEAPAHIGSVVSGRFYMLDSENADYVLVSDASVFALLPSKTPDQVLRCTDETIHLGRVVLENAAAIAHVPISVAPLTRHLQVLVAASLVGVAEGAGEMAAAYAKTREQFGQPIGAFQAIKHACANMALRSQAAWVQTVFASLSECDATIDAPAQTAAAFLLACDAAIANSEANVQVHGAMGFSSECDAHRYVKRAQVLARLCAKARTQEALLLEAVE